MAYRLYTNYVSESFKFKRKEPVLSKCSCGRKTFNVDKICTICRLEAKFLGIYDLQEVKEYSKSCLNVLTSGYITLKELFDLKENI